MYLLDLDNEKVKYCCFLIATNKPPVTNRFIIAEMQKNFPELVKKNYPKISQISYIKRVHNDYIKNLRKDPAMLYNLATNELGVMYLSNSVNRLIELQNLFIEARDGYEVYCKDAGEFIVRKESRGNVALILSKISEEIRLMSGATPIKVEVNFSDDSPI